MSKNKNFSGTRANSYSLALYELAEESKELIEIEKHSSSLINLIFNSDEFKSLIKNPTIKQEDLLIVISTINNTSTTSVPSNKKFRYIFLVIYNVDN